MDTIKHAHNITTSFLTMVQNMKYLVAACFLQLAFVAQAQNTFTVSVLDSKTNEPIIGAAIRVTNPEKNAITDIDGNASVQNLPNGKLEIAIEYVGYQRQTLAITLPQSAPTTVLLAEAEAELETVIVSATRTNSRIEDIATRIEVLGLDDVESENGLKPANIASLLGDLSVIHIQQNSGTSGASSVRMQGLDGKYTQILRDGMPLYEGFSGSFGVLQIPPLDLQQIEILKGSNATLYGGGAIGGLINLVSKEPTTAPEASITLNQSTLKETNVNGFYSNQVGKIGLTMFAGATYQKAVDVNADGFSDVPEVQATNLHPRFFYYINPKTTLKIGLSLVNETRNGGDIQALAYKTDSLHTFVERNNSSRQTLDAQFLTAIKTHQITVKGMFGNFVRDTDQSEYLFKGQQRAIFSEASDFVKIAAHDLVFGANYTADAYQPRPSDPNNITAFENRTIGTFVQDGWQINPKWRIEAGLRADFLTQITVSNAAKSTSFLLPRVAILYKARPNLSLRLSGGTGYKTPTVFTQQTVAGNLQTLQPIGLNIKPESSQSINGDINYHTTLFDKLGLTINQACYLTQITNPIILLENSFANATDNTKTIGTDTYFRLNYSHSELYLGYNHTISTLGSSPVQFAPRDKFAMTAAYEPTGIFRFGIESSWVANQYISETTTAPAYWFWAAMIACNLSQNTTLILNGENLLNVRQSRNEALFTGPISAPVFQQLYMPIDGRILNLSVRVKI